jgi:copper/silver efflux system protein
LNIILIPIGIAALLIGQTWGGLMLLAFGLVGVLKEVRGEKIEVRNEKFEGGKGDISTSTLIQQRIKSFAHWILEHAEIIIVVIGVIWLLARYWLPLGPAKSLVLNVVFVALIVILILGFFTILEYFYKPILKWCLNHKVTFLLIPSFLILFGITTWMGFNNVFGFVIKGFDTFGWNVRTTKVWSGLTHTFPAIGKEFMPSLNEGSFLLMPTSMPHSGFEYNRKVLGQLDMLISNIPEVEITVGKLGRVESALDPAPISMYENVINYRPEYMLNEKGRRVRFKVDKNDRFILINGDTLSNEEALKNGVTSQELIPDGRGNYYRNWRPEIKSPDDIWNEIVKVAKIPGVTSAPKLQPIETRLVMLQTGMRAPMGIKVYGPDLPTIEAFGMQLEEVLKEVPSVKAEAVFADRIVGKPYLHLNINRDEISRYGLNIEDVQQTIETAIGGMKVTSTVEGRERFLSGYAIPVNFGITLNRWVIF